MPDNDMPDNAMPDNAMPDNDMSDHDVPFRIAVTRSTRRRRSVSAQLVGNELRVSIPQWMSRHEEQSNVDAMVRRFKRRIATTDVDLMSRARTLAKAHQLQLPNRIEWADNLTAVWGLCTPADRHIRISNRLVGFPSWVLDYVIVHELAHLDVHGHSPEFWKIANRFPKAERAIGYLIAKSGDDANIDDTNIDDANINDVNTDDVNTDDVDLDVAPS